MRLPKYAGHPRTAGCHARTLLMGRQQGVPLLFSLAQLSYWSALHLGNAGLEAMKERGRVRVGKIADLTLFDPKTVTDHATYKAGENGLPPTGIPFVIVHGTVVVRQRSRSRRLKKILRGNGLGELMVKCVFHHEYGTERGLVNDVFHP